MKASKFVKKHLINTYNLNNTLAGTLTIKKLDELDKRFIDKEELKDKINEILKSKSIVQLNDMREIEMYDIEIGKEILKLLEE